MSVLDASMTAAWLFDDEEEPRVDAALTRTASETALVPQLWHLPDGSRFPCNIGHVARGQPNVPFGRYAKRSTQ